MKRGLAIFAFIVLASAGALAAPAGAQEATKDTHPAAYDSSKETTISGTINNVVKQPTGNMIPGGHLMISTSKGLVDAHVGGYALGGKHAIAVKSGDPVKLVGMMTTINSSQVFLVRTVEDAGRTYTIRNQNGLFATMPGRSTSGTLFKGSLR